MIQEKTSKISNQLSEICIFRTKEKLRSRKEKQMEPSKRSRKLLHQRCRAEVLRKANLAEMKCKGQKMGAFDRGNVTYEICVKSLFISTMGSVY